MAKIKLNGDTSGYIEISAPAVSGNNTLELGPGTRILTNLDNTFTGVSTFTSGLHVTGGNVLVGTTDSTIYNNGDSDSEGIVLRDGEVVDIARKGDLQLTLNRQTNDGPHIGFFRSGSPKTYISTRNDAFCIDTGGLNERLRVTSAGNVGINDSNPTAKLSVVGNAYVSADSFMGENSGIFFSGWNDYGAGVYGRNSGNDLVMNAGSSEKLRITSNGDVGIGTDNPTQKLEINNVTGGASLLIRTSPSTSGGNLLFGDDASDTSGRVGYIHSSDHMFFSTNGTERLRILSDGKVAIGGVTANSQLDVHGGDGISITNSGDTFLQSRTTGTTGTNYLEFKDSGGGAGAISYHHNGDSMRFKINGSERLRITSGGDVLIGGQSAYTYDDTGDSNTILDVWNSGNNKRGILSLSGNTNGGASIGTIWFNNDYNSGASPGNNMKLSAAIQSQAVTSDSNAGNDAGATLQFLTKPEGSPMVESMRITSDGDIYQRNQRVHTCLHTEYRQLSGGVNTDSVGSFVDIKNFGYTPKRAGSLIVCHFQVQTWNGSTTNMNGDIYFRARFDQGTGNYVSVTYGGNNNRMTGNLDQDNNRQHLFYTHTFGFTAQNTNQHTINLQASNGSSLSTDFNWFHTGDNANGCWIFEYDQ
jgi:hypothetical protein